MELLDQSCGQSRHHWTVSSSVPLFLAVLRKSPGSQFGDAMSRNKSKNNMREQQKTLNLN